VRKLFHSWIWLLVLGAASGQSGLPPDAIIMRKLQIAPMSTGVDVTMICTKPVVPQLQRLKNPDRVVIDLPNTVVGSQSRLIPVQSQDVISVRVEQFQNKPAITRVVLDLAGNREYSLESDGPKLVVHVRGVPVAPIPLPPPPTPAPATAAPAPTPVTAPARRGSPAPVTVAGARVPTGSSVTAGGETTVMRLARGGEVRVCPGTTVSVTPSRDGRDMMLAMGSGTIELDYRMPPASDTILTPDFRISLAGPGEFRYAISADSKGDTCIRGLLGNDAPLTVAELIGDGVYQVKPHEEIVFRSGMLARTDKNVPLECGCPPVRVPQLLASTPLPVTSPVQMAVQPAQPSVVPPPPAVPAGTASQGATPNFPVGTPLPPADQGQVHVQVDTPFIYRSAPSPEVIKQATALPLPRPPTPNWKEAAAAPPPAPKAAVASPPAPKTTQKGGFFHGLKRFFAAIFR
jgi:hypothetical protein